MQLATGEYTLRYHNLSSHVTPFSLTLRLAQSQTEIVLSNGVGQGPALSLRLISFQAAAALTPHTGPCPRPCRLRPRSPATPDPRTPAITRAVRYPAIPARANGGVLPGRPGRPFFSFADDGPCRPSHRHDSLRPIPGRPAFGRYGDSWRRRGPPGVCSGSRLTSLAINRKSEWGVSTDVVSEARAGAIASRRGRHGAIRSARGVSKRPDRSDRGRSGRRRPSAPGSCRGPAASDAPDTAIKKPLPAIGASRPEPGRHAA